MEEAMLEDSGGFLRKLALTASKYGLEGEVEEGNFILKHAGGIVISSLDSKIKIIIKDFNNIIVEERGSLQKKKVELDPSNPGAIVATAYYMWLDVNKTLRAKIFSVLANLGRKSSPTRECINIVNSIPGINYTQGLCGRLASYLAYGVYKYRALTGQTLSAKHLDEAIFISGSIEENVRDVLTGFLSIMRTFSRAYKNFNIVIETGNKLFETYGQLPAALKLGIELSAWLDRLKRGWQIYATALSAFSCKARLARKCTGIGLHEAALMGEVLWAQTGDGHIACETNNKLAITGALVNYSFTSCRPFLLRNGGGSVRCVSKSRPLCEETSIVIDPDPHGVRSAISKVLGGGYGVEIAYHNGEAIALVVSRNLEGITLINLGDTRIKHIHIALAGKKFSRFRGKLAPQVKPEKIMYFDTAYRLLNAKPL
jgi:hypothetical protein